MHHLRALGQKQPSGPRHAWIKRFFCASVHLISIIAGCLPRKFLPEVIAHQAAQALLHEHRDMVPVAVLNDVFHPLALRCDFPFAVSRFRSDDVPLRPCAADGGARPAG